MNHSTANEDNNQSLKPLSDEIVTSDWLRQNMPILTNEYLDMQRTVCNYKWRRYLAEREKLGAVITELNKQVEAINECAAALRDIYRPYLYLTHIYDEELKRRAKAAAASGKREAGE